MLSLVVVAGAEVGPAPDAGTWVADGPVYAIAQAGDRTFIGGDFSFVGPRTGSGVQLAPVGSFSSGKLKPKLGSFPEVSGGRVMDVAAAADGSWYLGGDFTHVGGVPRGGLARLVASSTGALAVDPGFAPQPDGPIQALVVGAIPGTDDDVLYVGGDFDSINGDIAHRNLAALDRATGLPVAPMASPDGAVGSIDVLRQDVTETGFPIVFVAGSFASVGGTAKGGAAAVWGVGAGANTGTLILPFSPSISAGTRRAVQVGQARWKSDTDHTQVGAPVYIGGDFGLVTFRFLVSVPDGVPSSGGSYPSSTHPAFGCTGCTATVHSIATSVDGATVYAGGRFDAVATIPRRNLAAIRGIPDVFASSAPPLAVRPWDPSPDGRVHAIESPVDEVVYLGGDFSHLRDAGASADTSRLGLAAVASSAPSSPGNDAVLFAWDPVATGGLAGAGAGTVGALDVAGGGVYAGGSFTSIGASAHENIAALDSTGALDDGWQASANGRVQALSAGNDRLYLGGLFTAVNGQQRARLAALGVSGDGALDTQFDPGVDPACTGAGCASGVLSLAVQDRTLYVGGSFASLAGGSSSNAAAVDAVTGAVKPWTPAPNGNVYALLATCGTVYAGGGFTQAGGQPRSRIAALDPSTGAATPWNPSAGDAVFALARDADVVYAGGKFTKIGGTQRMRVAGLDAASGRATSWDPGIPRPGDLVRALAVPSGGSVVYAGGRFTSAGDAGRVNLAAFDRGNGDATGWNPGAAGEVRTLSADAASVLGGGDFRQLGERMQASFGSFGMGGGAGSTATTCEAPEPEPQPEPVVNEEPPAPQAEPSPPPPSRPPPDTDRPAEPAADEVPPQLSGVRVTHRRFRTARGRSRRGRGARVGTIIKYAVSEAALVRFTFERRTRVRCRSRQWRDACRRWPSGKARIHCRTRRWKRRCHRWQNAGAMHALSEPGAAEIAFKGKLAGRWLRPGTYRVALRAVDLEGNRSGRVRRSLRVVRR